MSLSWRPLLQALGAAALFGASTPAAKGLLGECGPWTLAGLLYLGAALGVAPWAVRGLWAQLRGAGARNLWRLAGAVLAGGVVGPLLLLKGLEAASASSVALWLTLETPWTALLGWAFFREHMERRAALAAALTLGASAMLAAPGGASGWASALLVAGACACWGLDNNLTAVIDGLTPSRSTFVKGLVAGVCNLSLGLLLEAPPSAGAGGLGLGLGALSYGASLVLYVGAAQQLGATRSQLVFSTAPLWGVLLAWGALGEPLGWPHALAALMMAGAVGLLSAERHEHAHTHEAARHTHWHRHDDGHHGHKHEGTPDWLWHSHEHEHEPVTHAHAHRPDLHHRHRHP